LSVLFQIEVKIWARAQLKNGTEAVVVYFNSVVLLDHSPVVEVLVNFIFSNCMFDIVILYLFAPTVIKVMDLACNFLTILEIKCLIYF
jgi:hypothetical protein